MFRILISLIFLLATQSFALDLSKMSAAERALLQEEIRLYLLENPEIIMEAVEVLRKKEQQAAIQSDFELVKKNKKAIFDDGFSFIGGNPNGDITLVEFVDYRCGYCKKAHNEVEQLLSTDGNIRFVIKEFPILGEDSLALSKFALAVKIVHGDEMYKLVHDILIKMKSPPSEKAFDQIMNNLNLDADRVESKMESNEVNGMIAYTRTLAERLKISGTPTFVMNDELIRGYVPLDALINIVDNKRD
jgi:protein-disulfide isomerase